ncbi:hypothetical protein H7C18_18105, partial [Cohnella sp. CBP 2801]|nr:hypothetical protein [Cohnella zeiphila]
LRAPADAAARAASAAAPETEPAAAMPNSGRLHAAPAGAGAGGEPPPAASGRDDAAGPMAGGADGSGARAAAVGGNAQRPDASWLGRMLQWLGVEHERQALQLAGDGADGAARADGGEADASRTADTLKSALLALAASDDLPPALREAAQGMAHQITGQQLLLAPERQNTAMMSHMTLFVPLKVADGDTTATIHVQTRRGRKGEWDSGNCRLMFDLRMSHLGDTLVDVQVVDHAVSLKLLNDRPWVAELVESARGEAAAGLRAAGYQLLSLQTSPFPVLSASKEEKSANAARQEGSAAQLERLAAGAYAAKPYKGVDYLA